MRQSPRQIERLNALNTRYANLARAAGIKVRKDGRTGRWRLPTALSPETALQVRAQLEALAAEFALAQQNGQRVYWVTICNPDWTCGAGELSPSLVKEVQVWMRGRAQRLSKHGQQRMAGAVDVAWNDKRAVKLAKFWCVHAHVLICLDDVPAENADDLIRSAFKCPSAPHIDGRGPVWIERLPGPSDVKETLRYASGAVALVDGNPHKYRHYRKRLSQADQSPDHHRLRPKRQAEYTRLLAEVGPSAFLILSGFQRRGGKINRVESKVTARLKAQAQQIERARVAQDAAFLALEAACLAGRDAGIASMIARIAVIAADYHAAKAARMTASAMALGRSSNLVVV